VEAKELEVYWADLAGEDAARAWKAICALAARPEQALPLLKQRLPPNPKLAPNRLAQLLADLDAKEFKSREQACIELAKLGPVVVPVLRKLNAAKPSAEVKLRVDMLLSQLDKRNLLTEEVRCARALEVLEYLGTPDASKLIQVEAQGEPAFQRTQNAKAALERLAKLPPVP
jgi:hypothetical protein